MASTPLQPAPATGSSGVIENFRRLCARRETIRYLTAASLKSGHRDKVLGHLWNLLDPLMFMLVYYFVFGVLFNLAGGGKSIQFMLYILIGVLTWRFIQSSVAQAANCIRGNRGLIHEINFPKAVFPVAGTLARLYDFLWGLVALSAFLLVAGLWPSVHYLWLPLLVLLATLFAAGVSFVIAYLGAFYADTANVLDVALRLLFYVSPIFYYVRPKPGIADEKVFLHDHELAYSLYMMNPIACFFECFRDVLLWHEPPQLNLLAYVAGVSVLMFIGGFALFTRGEGRFAKYV